MFLEPTTESVELVECDLSDQTPIVTNMQIFDPPSSHQVTYCNSCTNHIITVLGFFSRRGKFVEFEVDGVRVRGSRCESSKIQTSRRGQNKSKGANATLCPLPIKETLVMYSTCSWDRKSYGCLV